MKMLNKIMLPCFLVVIHLFCNAQRPDYSSTIAKGKVALDENNNEVAIQYFQKAFQSQSPEDWPEVIGLATAFARLQMADSAFKYHDLAINRFGYGSYSQFAISNEFYLLKDDARYQQTLDLLKSKQTEKLATTGIDLETFDQLQALYIADQRVRQQLRFLPAESPEIEKVVEKVLKVDNKNQKELKRMIEEQGWPGEAKVGPLGAGYAFLIALHSEHNLKNLEFFYNAFKTAVENGEADAEGLVTLKEKVELRKQLNKRKNN